LTVSASREAVGRTNSRRFRRGAPRREWPALAKRRNTADERFPARPKGPTRMTQYGVAVLEKGLPFPADCALSWIIRVALNPSISPRRSTNRCPHRQDPGGRRADKTGHSQPNSCILLRVTGTTGKFNSSRWQSPRSQLHDFLGCLGCSLLYLLYITFHDLRLNTRYIYF